MLAGRQVVMRGVSWEEYVAWNARFEELGYGRVSYCDGVLEIMSVTKLHERVRAIIGRLITDYALKIGKEPDSAGCATIGDRGKDAGKEPDDSFWFDRVGVEDDPDLVVEVVVSSEAISKQSFYARFGIPELWIWENGGITVYLLSTDQAAYEKSARSRIFPDLDLALIERCCQCASLGEAIREFQRVLQADG